MHCLHIISNDYFIDVFFPATICPRAPQQGTFEHFEKGLDGKK
jgi:hypothetical protein